MTEHSKTPWKWQENWLDSADNKTVIWYTNADDGVHCRPEDAAFITQACNNYFKLVAALEFYADGSNYGHCDSNNAVCYEEGKVARQVLSDIKGKEMEK